MIIKRRDLLAATAAAAVVPAKAKDAPHPKRPVVLVHGASHGGWCWRDVRRRLQAKGLDVFTPTLTGLGERVHLRNADITLATHITDVVNVITWEELKQPPFPVYNWTPRRSGHPIPEPIATSLLLL